MEKAKWSRLGAGFLVLLATGAVLWLYLWVFHSLPSPEHLEDYLASADSYLYVPLSQIPLHLQHAAIAVEDGGFYSRSSRLDPVAILRSIWYAVQCADGGCLRPRAATIPQQLAVMLMSALGTDYGPSLRQDLRDLALSTILAQHYAPDQVLEYYLNAIPYADGIRGGEAASMLYLGKHVGDLDLGECAMLQAMRRLPATAMNIDSPLARKRQARVLELMVENGYIGHGEVDAANTDQFR